MSSLRFLEQIKVLLECKTYTHNNCNWLWSIIPCCDAYVYMDTMCCFHHNIVYKNNLSLQNYYHFHYYHQFYYSTISTIITIILPAISTTATISTTILSLLIVLTKDSFPLWGKTQRKKRKKNEAAIRSDTPNTWERKRKKIEESLRG